ncbi:MAG: hypothetical protein K1Y36_30495 [Blastocatellia bacterium]|nr:hypothetical protein [Blastocatellia bacterium]
MRVPKPTITKRSSFQAGRISPHQFASYLHVWGRSQSEFCFEGADHGEFDVTGEVTLKMPDPVLQAQDLLETARRHSDMFGFGEAFAVLHQAAELIRAIDGAEAGRLRARLMAEQGRLYCGLADWKTAQSCFEDAFLRASRWDLPEIREASRNGIRLTNHHLNAADLKAA